MSSTSRPSSGRSRSRSADRHSHSRSRKHERRDSRSRSRSRSPGSRHHHRSHRRSRSRSSERRHHHHSKHSSRHSPHKHSSSSSRHDATTVKKEVEEAPTASSATAAVKREGFSSAGVKSERGAAASSHHVAAASSVAAAASAGLPDLATGLKTEAEPSEADIIRALDATASAAAAAAASSGAPSSQSATAAPAVVPVSQQQVNYAPSGLLAAAANTVNGVEVKYAEPVDARMPDKQWRLYVFKDKKQLDEPLRIHRQSMYMIGRDEKVCDLPIAHPSCSKQHAVIQFRQRETFDAEGNMKAVIKPYLMDLGSTNGTWLMGIRREPQKYYELLENDILKFGFSSREYVLINSSK